ncbi:nitrile hydratase subunit alpha [Pseudomonas sp. BN605]|uniref:nitrile hydratase n=1 Tax=Pseudomonas hunanensis TaxID=1247546 RepID=A0ABD6MWI4_9PSED|nr:MULTISPECIES: nitrile hydratase subunit alpha [Pseudomonas]MDH4847971.1 nitrile hydratase subunit alpha [Pseudomonas sp. BN605]NWL45599.1 nitrile hydratase subunit alpha [Pseudomonas hunanensis]
MSEHKHHQHDLSEGEVRAKALESLLKEKGILQGDVVDSIVSMYTQDIGPMNGAKAIAKAWVDPEYKKRLLANATKAVAELGISGMEGENLVAVENTDDVHHVIVCTLCSCYPWPVLGLPPRWYKDAPYRSRVVREPRSVLAEFGTVVPDSKEVKVLDSNVEVRYFIMPQRPAGSEDMTENELAALITRDSMVGVTVLPPVVRK